MILASVEPLYISPEKRRPKPLKIKIVEDEEPRLPPTFLPPDAPLPSPKFTKVDLIQRLHTPIQSPIASPFRSTPIKLIDDLIHEEELYLAHLEALRQIIVEKVLGQALHRLSAAVNRIYTLTKDLLTTLSNDKSYFAEPQKNCLLKFADAAGPAYQAYFSGFLTGLADHASGEQQVILTRILAPWQTSIEVRDLDWLLRRPLSRVKAYSTLYKKLLHSSDDATDLFLAYESFHTLLAEARTTVARAKATQSGPEFESQLTRVSKRSVSGESTSTQSSSTSKLTPNDELLGLQHSLDASQCIDIFSLSPQAHTLNLTTKANEPARTIINRANFQLTVYEDAQPRIDALVEMILLTDQLLITKPSFTGPQLLFAPLLRGVFHVSCPPSEPRILELDIVGKQTLRFTAASKQAQAHWYELLLACEDYKLESVPEPPASLAAHVGQSSASSVWLPLAPQRLPPTPPHTTIIPSFGGFAPLGIIRENSQLSIANYSESGHRTPDTHDQPFQFDSEEEATPRAINVANPLERSLAALQLPTNNEVRPRSPLVEFTEEEAKTPRALEFPDPPRRHAIEAPSMRKSKTVDLFAESPHTGQVMNDMSRSRTLPHSSSSPLVTGTEFKKINEEDTFDESALDRPSLPAFDFGDGIKRPSSVALKFSPKTMLNFGIPMRKVPQPKPLEIPTTNPLQVPVKDTLIHRRTGSHLTLPVKPVAKATESISLMAECYTWDNGTWIPILMDEIDSSGMVKTVRSSVISIKHGADASLQIYDKRDQITINTFPITSGTSIIRDDSCDISVGFDAGFDKVYYMFRCEKPESANLMQSRLEEIRRNSAQTGFMTPSVPAQARVEHSTTLIEGLKVKLYRSQEGKWINKGSARIGITLIANTRSRRLRITSKVKKERILMVDTIIKDGDCEVYGKTSILVPATSGLHMIQLKNSSERARVLGFLIDF